MIIHPRSAAESGARQELRRTTALKRLLISPRTEYILEAHNGLSARIVEQSGFAGVWASGLSISASLGVRDCNEASWTQVLDVVEFMTDATAVPILIDADTGYGNFNNTRRLVKKLEQIGVAGMCIEDKVFPKTNSFIDSEQQPLAEIDEFAGKIAAAKDAQRDDDFQVIARVEALIAGWGMEEALRRADAYRDAGADAILIHSKRRDAGEVMEFMARWQGGLPVVAVPTMYFETPAEQFEAAGIGLVIWANHMLRSAVRAMQEAAEAICQKRSVAMLEGSIVPIPEIFRLQDVEELKEAERRFLPRASNGGAAPAQHATLPNQRSSG